MVKYYDINYVSLKWLMSGYGGCMKLFGSLQNLILFCTMRIVRIAGTSRAAYRLQNVCHKVSIGSGNGLAPNRRQAITRTNDNPNLWCHASVNYSMQFGEKYNPSFYSLRTLSGRCEVIRNANNRRKRKPRIARWRGGGWGDKYDGGWSGGRRRQVNISLFHTPTGSAHRSYAHRHGTWNSLGKHISVSLW